MDTKRKRYDALVAKRKRGVRLFLSNAVLCLKGGGTTTKITDEWAHNCAANFIREEIEIIAPKVVDALGQIAYTAVLTGFCLQPRPGPLRNAVEEADGTALPNGSKLLAVYHCAPGIVNRTRSLAEQKRDWKRVAKALK
jgi:uracil-DNA glycosylase